MGKWLCLNCIFPFSDSFFDEEDIANLSCLSERSAIVDEGEYANGVILNSQSQINRQQTKG